MMSQFKIIMQSVYVKELINCDLGECLSPNPDPIIMPLIGMANIACGGHAGNNQSMQKTIALAKQNNAKIGAHPSYLDTANFGRISHHMSRNKLFEMLYTQVSNFSILCHAQHIKMSYVKPHGALYHDMLSNPEILAVLIEVVQSISPKVKLVVQAGINKQYFADFERDKNIHFLYEAFADRAYQDRTIIPRTKPGAVLNNPQAIIKQYFYFLNHPPFKIDTICFHSDNQASVEALQELKSA